MLKKTGIISQTQKEQILKASDIAQIIGEFVRLKPSGKNLIGLCPFHQEKTPSFVVSPSYQSYKCFGCGESGDVIRFVMGIENLSFPEALDHLARKAGLDFKYNKKQPVAQPQKTETERCLEESYRFFQNNLKKASNNSEITKYLQLREISGKVVESFQLGCVDSGWTNLNKYLLDRSFSNEVQEKAGLIKKGEKGGFYDRLRNRLIFPIRDKRKRLLGFAGRAIGDEKPKYLNPPETELYKKSQLLYGIFESQTAIRRNRRAIIVEGYLDAIRLHEQSWEETVATCGTAITKEHIKLLISTGAEEAVLLFDGDKAGMKAAERSARLFIENDLDSKVVVLPDGLDPDDYFKKFTSDDFSALLENAAYDFEFIIGEAINSFSTKGIKYRETKIKEVINLANQIESTIKKDLFLSKASKEFNLDKRKLNKLLTQPTASEETFQSQQKTNSAITIEKVHVPEVKFLQYLIRHVESIKLARKEVVPDDFINNDLSRIYARFLQLSDDEFMLLNANDFPVIFAEHETMLMYLLYNESEYKGPAQDRATVSEEMKMLRADNKKRTENYSEKAILLLVHRLKKNRKSFEIKKMRYIPPNEVKQSVKQLIEKRNKPAENTNHKIE